MTQAAGMPMIVYMSARKKPERRPPLVLISATATMTAASW